MAVGEIGDHREVILDGNDIDAAGQVIGAGQNQYGLGLQVDDIGLEPPQHFAGDLAADAAIDEIAVRKVLVQTPEIGNGIAEKHDAPLALLGRRQFLVGFRIARQVVAIAATQLGLALGDCSAEMGLDPISGGAEFDQLLAGLGREGIRPRDGFRKGQIGADVGEKVVGVGDLIRPLAEVYQRLAGVLQQWSAGAIQFGNCHGGGFHQLQHAGIQFVRLRRGHQCGRILGAGEQRRGETADDCFHDCSILSRLRVTVPMGKFMRTRI